MFGIFKKKKEEKKPERRMVYIPPEHISQLLSLRDDYQAAVDCGESSALKYYEFWSAAEFYCPEIKVGKWRPRFFNGAKPGFEEALPGDYWWM